MIFIEVLIIILSAILNFIGGWKWHNARRYIMPVVIGIGVSIVSQVYWLGLTVLPTMGTLSIGYGEKSILYKYLSDFWCRATWMLMQSILFGAGCLIFNHLSWYVYIPYCIISLVLGGLLRNINEIIGDLIFGVCLSSFILFVR